LLERAHALGPVAWRGERELAYDARAERYLTVIDAVANGCCAVLDIDRDALEPIHLG
jgi:hypothetical protein